MELEYNGNVVFVSGGTKGIGLAMVKGFLSEGASVAYMARDRLRLNEVARELESSFSSNSFLGLQGDGVKEEEVKSALQEAVKWKGSINILLSNVGDGRSVPDPISNKTQFKTVWDTNFTTAENLARIGLNYLDKTNGVILFVSSITGIEALGAPTDYSTAKAALIALSKNLARKLAPGIRVNCLAPGNIFFDGGSWDEKLKADPDRVNSMLESAVPMKRFGTPEEIADAALFLCSSRAKFITGSCLTIDGGQTVAYH